MNLMLPVRHEQEHVTLLEPPIRCRQSHQHEHGVNMSVKLTKSDQAYRQLKEHLRSGTFRDGERLTEAKVARVLGMGRGPVRESMLRLEAEGHLHSKGAFGGMFVKFVEAHSREELIWRYELRGKVDGLAARLAADNMTGRQIARLRDLDKAVRQCLDQNDRTGRAEASKAFHDYLLQHCGNPLLIRVANTFDLHPVVGRQPDLDRKLLSAVSTLIKEGGTWNTPAVNAIAGHNPEEAERMMQLWIGMFVNALRESDDPDQ